MRAVRKMLAGLLAAAIAASCAATAFAADPSHSTPPAEQPTVEKDVPAAVGSLTVEMNTSKKGNAAVNKVEETAKPSVRILPNVTVNGVKYKVTIVRKGAFAECKDAKRVTLPGTLTHIRRGAFTGAESLKNIVYNGRKSVSVQKGSFKGLATKKMTFTVNNPKMTYAQYKKLVRELRAAGFKGTIRNTSHPKWASKATA